MGAVTALFLLPMGSVDPLPDFRRPGLKKLDFYGAPHYYKGCDCAAHHSVRKGGSTMPRVIKKYVNRRLYDVQEKKTVTLQDVAELVKKGEDVMAVSYTHLTLPTN